MRRLLLLIGLLMVVMVKGAQPMRTPALKIYYGVATSQALRRLRQYQLAIIEPDGWRLKQVAQLQTTTAVYGYVNVMEQEPAYNLSRADALRVNGKLVANKQFKTYLLDLTKAPVRQALTQKVARIAKAGYTGVFLDTIGDIDDYLVDHPQHQRRQRRALANWLRTMKRRFAQLQWMQNRGFETFMVTTRPLISQLLWEDFQAQAFRSDAWSQRWLQQLQRTDVKLYAVCSDQASLQLAAQLGITAALNRDDIYDDI